MELSILLARVAALIYLSFGVAALAGTIDLKSLVKDLRKSPASTAVFGAVGIILGMLILNYHSVWEANWRGLISLIGVISVVKGITYIIYPQFVDWFKPLYKNGKLAGAICVLLGVLFAYYGFLV